MTVNDVLRMNAIDINRLTTKELKEAVSIAASAANKRLARLEASETGEMSPAYQKAMERTYTTSQGGKFGVAGKNRNQLMAELKATKDFLSKKTSSVKGFKQVRKEREKRLGGSFSSKSAEAEYWAAYRKIEEMHPELIGHHGSDEVQQMLYQMMADGEGLQEYLDEINAVNAPGEDVESGIWINEQGHEVHYDGSQDDYISMMNELLRIDYEKKQGQINDNFRSLSERNNG